MSIATDNRNTENVNPQGRPDRNGLRLPIVGMLLTLHPGFVTAVALAFGLTVAAYWGAITWWVYEWTREGSFYAHGIFIPFFVALMVWRDRERLRRLPVERCWWGLGLVLFALTLVLLSHRAQVTVPFSVSFIVFLIGSALVVAGKRITRALLFPMLFLFTMIPIVPDQLINPIAFPIQLVSAKMAAGICSLIGFPASVNGTQVILQSYRMNVELPCSGFKTLLGLLSFSAAFAYVVEGATWKRWLLVAISGPLAILINGLRITLIGLVGETFGEPTAHMFHDYSGFIVLILGFTFLFNLARILKCDNFLGVPLTDPPDRSQPTRTSTTGDSAVTAAQASAEDRADKELRERTMQAGYDEKWGRPRRMSLSFFATGLYPVIGALAVTVAVKPAIVAPKPPVGAVASQDIPRALNSGQWTAEEIQSNVVDIPITPEVKEALNPISYINRLYVGGQGTSGHVEFLLTSGNGRKVFHDPHTCFLGSGYYMHDVGVETIQTAVGPLKVQVSEAERNEDHTRTLLMFCYLVDGNQYQTTQQVNTALIWQLLFGDSGRPSYFLRFRQMNLGTDETRREELRTFIKAIWSEIGSKAVGSDKLRQVASR